MANNKKPSKRNAKALNQNTSVLITIIAVFVLVFIGIMVAVGNHENKGPEYSEIDTQNSTTDSSTTLPQKNEPATENSTVDSSEPTKTEPTSNSKVEIPTKQPTGSFYDEVKYRSPDAVPADIFKHGRSLMLLNRQYELPENFKWDLVYWANGNSVDAMYLNCEERNSVKAVDRAAYTPLKNLFTDAEKAGVPLQLVSAYRSIYLQDKLFTRSVNSYISQGYSETDAINKANYARTFSGTSEHNTGLGFDILQKGNFTLSTSFENSAQFKWLMENAESYGFILRYNKDKVDKTGIMYEPWHFRYVGVEHAKKINELGLCLEEYIDYLEGRI